MSFLVCSCRRLNVYCTCFLSWPQQHCTWCCLLFLLGFNVISIKATPTNLHVSLFSSCTQLLPKRVDWLGVHHHQTYEQVVSVYFCFVLNVIVVLLTFSVMKWCRVEKISFPLFSYFVFFLWIDVSLLAIVEVELLFELSSTRWFWFLSKGGKFVIRLSLAIAHIYRFQSSRCVVLMRLVQSLPEALWTKTLVSHWPSL